MDKAWMNILSWMRRKQNAIAKSLISFKKVDLLLGFITYRDFTVAFFTARPEIRRHLISPFLTRFIKTLRFRIWNLAYWSLQPDFKLLLVENAGSITYWEQKVFNLFVYATYTERLFSTRRINRFFLHQFKGSVTGLGERESTAEKGRESKVLNALCSLSF